MRVKFLELPCVVIGSYSPDIKNTIKCRIIAFKPSIFAPPAFNVPIAGHPSVRAYGDDEDENAKAALHALKESDGSMPTVAFFITDAGYHRKSRDSDTALAEEKHLRISGEMDTDFYVLFDSVSTLLTNNSTYNTSRDFKYQKGRATLRKNDELHN